MENEENNEVVKRVKPSEKETAMADDQIVNTGEETDGDFAVFEQMELDITNICERINRFTRLVSELMESGKAMLKELSNEFEERMILIHKAQMDKWQEEIKELRLLDASNEEINAVLLSAKSLFQTVSSDT